MAEQQDLMNAVNEEERIDLGDDDIETGGDSPWGPGENGQKPWLLIGVGAVAVILIIVIVLRLTMGGGSRNDDTELLAIPDSESQTGAVAPQADDFIEGANKIVAVESGKPADKTEGIPERVVEQRDKVEFNPEKPVKPKIRTAATPAKPKPKPTQNTAPAATGGLYVQVGSFDSRASAESERRNLLSAHVGLFSGRDIVILTGVVNGQTKHRLRVPGFKAGADASDFCKRAANSGVACFVTK